MYSSVYGADVSGIEARIIRIEADVSDGLPVFDMVGYLASAVKEAKKESGSLITANAALEQGKDVFVIPGRIGDVLSEGCNRLICQGAIPVLSPNDILEYYDLNTYNIEETPSDLEQKIELCMGTVPVHVHEIAGKLEVELTEVLKEVTKLAEKKRIRQVGRGYYIKN